MSTTFDELIRTLSKGEKRASELENRSREITKI